MTIAIFLLIACDDLSSAAELPISDAISYLVQFHCVDGSLPLAGCTPVRRQGPDDPLLFRRHDWPPPKGYQITDSFIGAGGQPQTVWNFAPVGPVNTAKGGGGEIYHVAADGSVTVAATQDGGKPGMQYFVGPACGGTGWLMWRANPPTGSWAQAVARLSDAADPAACPPLDRAYTRWRRETVSIPFIQAGRHLDQSVDTIITEHFDGPGIGTSRHMERSLFGQGWGRLVWEAWGMDPPTVKLQARCPGTAWSTPPAPGWQMEDCRYATNIVADSGLTGATLGWPAR